LRLYPPYAFAVLASAAACVLIQPQDVDDLSDWFNNESWALPITPQVVLGELAMLNQHQYMTLLNPGWALIHILRISLIFPLIFFALRARPLTTLAATIALSVAANWAQAQPNAPFWMKEVGGGAQYLASFALGGWIFLARESIARVVAPLWMKLALTAGAI